MTEPNWAEIDDATREALADIAAGNMDPLTRGSGQRRDAQERSGLDARTFALVKVAALVALDAPPGSYSQELADAISGAVTPEEILDVLVAIAPQVGSPRVVSAATEIMAWLGLPPGTGFDDDDDDDDFDFDDDDDEATSEASQSRRSRHTQRRRRPV